MPASLTCPPAPPLLDEDEEDAVAVDEDEAAVGLPPAPPSGGGGAEAWLPHPYVTIAKGRKHTSGSARRRRRWLFTTPPTDKKCASGQPMRSTPHFGGRRRKPQDRCLALGWIPKTCCLA
jgi:hypothetical protein